MHETFHPVRRDMARILQQPVPLHASVPNSSASGQGKTRPMAPIPCTYASKSGITDDREVVEIKLLLPASWANALIEMSKRRQQTVGQILRSIIRRALTDGGRLGD